MCVSSSSLHSVAYLFGVVSSYTVVLQAEDEDAGDNGTVAYSLYKSSNTFSIDSTTGAVYSKVSSFALSSYQLYVEATDKKGHATGRRTTQVFKVCHTLLFCLLFLKIVND